jgi:hypothetical protein
MSDDTPLWNPEPIPRRGIVAFVVYFAVILPAGLAGLYWLINTNSNTRDGQLVLSAGELMLVVMLSGLVGSYIHAVNSFVSYVGNRRFYKSWASWYVLRPFLGVAMALVFYVAVRGGVLVLSGGNSTVDPYAMMTVAALAGMFSKQASDKLAEVFDTLFRSRADEERRDKLQNPVPKLTALEPAKVAVGAAAKVTLRGEGFVPESVVRVGTQSRQPKFEDATRLTLELSADDLKTAGELSITVFNPPPSGGTSSTLVLVVSTEIIPAPPIVPPPPPTGGSATGAGAGSGAGTGTDSTAGAGTGSTTGTGAGSTTGTGAGSSDAVG